MPNQMAAEFHGQLKSERPGPIVIPLLVPYELLRKGLDALRVRQGNWNAVTQQFDPVDPPAPGKKAQFEVLAVTNDDVNHRYADALNRYLKKKEHFFATVTPHDLRRYYARAVWIGYAYENEHVTFSQVVKRFLGHTISHGITAYENLDLQGFTHRFEQFRLPLGNGWVDKGSDMPEYSDKPEASEASATPAPDPVNANVAVAAGNSVELTDCEFHAMSQRLTEREFQAISQLRLVAGAKRPCGCW
jgi:hypothetical protein